MAGGPIFVGGLERTGTSLLYALLASHPGVAMTRRTNWWTYFDGRFGDLAEDVNFERCLAAMMRYRRHRKLEPDADRLRTEFRAGERSYCRLFALLEEHHAERVGKPRWGDKSLHTERYAERVFECFPDARILHMVRDPRDRYASALKRWRSNRGGVGSATAAWIASVRLGERNQARYPNQFRIVRYETLANDPEATLRDLCAFVDEPYEPAMLAMGGASDFREAGGNSSFGRFATGHISTASIGRYRNVLSESQVAFMQALAGDAMAAHGYEPSPIALSGPGVLRYRLIDRPTNVALMGAWRLREAWFDLTGRSPSGHTMGETT
ncbi:MAG: sulfotransferase family protein [Candidatus Limnocylindria bacterium]